MVCQDVQGEAIGPVSSSRLPPFRGFARAIFYANLAAIMLHPNDTVGEAPEVASPARAEATAPGLWATVREAIRGSHQNYTEGSIGRSIFLLSVPMVLETCMESVFAVADVFYVGRLGPEGVIPITSSP